MGRVISIVNQKGGVGKTTTCINLSACLAQAGKKVLTIDLDPQGNTTSGLGIDKDSLKETIYTVLSNECSVFDIIQKTPIETLSLLPSNRELVAAEIELSSLENSQYILKDIINFSLRKDYDFIIIDCPPSLNLLTINALTASDSVIVPVQCEYYALEALNQLTYSIRLVQDKLNPKLKLEGVVFTMYDSRLNLSMQVVEETKKILGLEIYKCIVPRNVRLAEAPSHGLPISLYDAKSKGADAYNLLAEQVIQRGEA